MGNDAVGVFDSGLGGLTVVKEIKAKYPNQKIIYLGDTARVPYGTRSKEVVTEFALADVAFLLSKQVKMIVVACNTVSALAIEEVKKTSPVPVWGVIEPGVKGAVAATKSRRVGVIGTRATIGSGMYQALLRERGMEVVAQACPLFVPLIEEGEFEGEWVKTLVKRYLQPVKQANVDTLIMGCTHYPLLEPLLAEEMEGGVKLVNGGREVANMLPDLNEQSDEEDEFWVTDVTERYREMAGKFLGKNVKIAQVKL